MKKIILLFSVFAMAFTSCESDDDDSGSQDPLVGTWKYSQYFEDDVEYALTTCESLDTYVALSNGTFTATIHDEMGTGCEVEFTRSGTWENRGSDIYAFTENNLIEESQITFSGNKMFIDNLDISSGVTYRDVYTRE